MVLVPPLFDYPPAAARTRSVVLHPPFSRHENLRLIKIFGEPSLFRVSKVVVTRRYCETICG
jgi:hypothetical protein